MNCTCSGPPRADPASPKHWPPVASSDAPARKYDIIFADGAPLFHFSLLNLNHPIYRGVSLRVALLADPHLRILLLEEGPRTQNGFTRTQLARYLIHPLPGSKIVKNVRANRVNALMAASSSFNVGAASEEG